MGRWPDSSRSTLVTALIMFVGFPLLCLLAWWWVRGWANRRRFRL